MRFTPVRREGPRIDISSLVDVLFLLIIFFAISTTFVSTTGVTVRPPASTTAPASRGGLEVLVGSDGTVAFAGSTLRPDEVLTRLPEMVRQTLEARGGGGRVVVRGDEGVAYGTLFRVLDAVREAGVEAFVLATRGPPKADEDS